MLYARWETTNYGVNADGYYAEYVAVPDALLVPLPEGFSFEEGSAFTTNFLTAYFAITRHGAVNAGDAVLISGATGNVGFAAVQIAQALGLKPLAIVSTTEKARSLEARIKAPVIDLSRQSLAEAMAPLSAGDGPPPLGIDPVGGELCVQMLRCLARGGRLVCIGYSGGSIAPLTLRDLIVQQRTMIGYEPSGFSTSDRRDALLQLRQWGEAGLIRPRIDSSYPMAQWGEAFDRLTSRKAIGSIVLTF